MVKHSVCNVCGSSFSYEYDGKGRLRRYCEKHKKLPNDESGKRRICVRCGKEFDSPQTKAKWCRDCKQAADAEYAREYRERVKQQGIEITVPSEKKCGHCGVVKLASDFSAQRDRPNGLTGWCKECRRLETKRKRDAAPKKPKQPRNRTPNGLYCSVCGTELVGAQKNVCSDRECHLEDTRRRSYQHDSAKKVMKERKCKECGKLFTPEYGNKRRIFCSKGCLDKWNHRQHHIGGDLNGRARKHFRKAHGCVLPLMYQYINWRKVLDRDMWVCGICGEQIDKDMKFPDDGSPSVDHIVPLAQGGAHLYSNVQAAHFKCNWMKGDGTHV